MVLTDDDGGQALFSLNALGPAGDSFQCLEIVYEGTARQAEVRLHATTSGDLAPYLDLTIERGSGGIFGDCSSFSPGTVVYQGTLGDLAAEHDQWSSGVVVFNAVESPTVESLRITVRVRNDPAAANTSAQADSNFSFEGQ